MKICVYTICKNELQFIERYLEHLKDADLIHISDTGSTDGTWEKLNSLLPQYTNLVVDQISVTPWRFDVARNQQLDKIYEMNENEKNDWMYFQVDIDEYPSIGWYSDIQNAILQYPYINRATYRYCFNYFDNGTENIVFNADKIHNYNYKWINAVHEVLVNTSKCIESSIHISGFTLEHHSIYKERRKTYLELLKFSVDEDPNNDRNLHYYGRELVYTGQYEEAIKYLKQHLTIGTWNQELASSCRYISESYINLNNYEQAENYYKKGIEYSKDTREPYYWYCKFLYEHEKWLSLIKYANIAIQLINNNDSYIHQNEAYGPFFYDKLCLAYFYGEKNKYKALESAYCALGIAHITNDSEIKRYENNVKCCL